MTYNLKTTILKNTEIDTRENKREESSDPKADKITQMWLQPLRGYRRHQSSLGINKGRDEGEGGREMDRKNQTQPEPLIC